MPPTDPTLILLAHDRWATRNILKACEPLTIEQLHRKFEMGCGSLHDTLVHVISAMRVWADILGQRPVRTRLTELPARSVGELIAMYNQAAEDLSIVAMSGPLDQPLQHERLGTVYTYTRATIITHVTTHGMHHRAQMLNMLRHVGEVRCRHPAWWNGAGRSVRNGKCAWSRLVSELSNTIENLPVTA